MRFRRSMSTADQVPERRRAPQTMLWGLAVRQEWLDAGHAYACIGFVEKASRMGLSTNLDRLSGEGGKF